MRIKPVSRLLKKNRLSRHPQYYCFVDTETIPTQVQDNKTIQVFRLGVAILLRLRSDGHKSKRQVIHFSSIQEFWDKSLSFVKGKNTLNIIAHNALFDMTVLRFQTTLSRLGYDCLFIFDEGLTFISKWRNQEKRIMILDNSNWFKGKLSKWGAMLGLEKMVMPDYDARDQEWFPYCERDVEILERLQLWLIEFLANNDLGNWKYTLAGLSFTAYRHRFMDYPIYIPQESPETVLARQAYKGGRTECFYSGECQDGPFYKLDINSMYPYLMKINEYPTNVEGIVINPSLKSIEKGLRNYAAIGEFIVNLTEAVLPHKINGKTTYPLGKFTAFLSTPEISYLLQSGQICDCKQIAYYRKRPIFRSFVDYFYSKRMAFLEEGDVLRSYMFKIYMNSLYGKFGQRGFDDRIIGQAPIGTVPTSFFIDAKSKEKGVIRQIGANVIKSTRGGEGHNAFTAIATHVTAFARTYLYTLLKLAGRSNVFYCDTDSILCNRVGFDNLSDYISDTVLGMLKLEGVADELTIVSPKHYAFGKEWKIKGVSKSAKRLGNDTYRQEIWPGLNTLLKEDSEYYYNYSITKHLTARVSSGIISSEGFVNPFCINEVD